MKTRKVVMWAVVPVLVLAVTNIALAFTLSNVDGTWGYIDGVTESSSTGQPNSNEGAICSQWATGNGDGATTTSDWNTVIQTPPDTDENQVRYGGDGCSACLSFANQSGFGFDGNDNVGTPAANTPFYLGKFIHYNNPISASSCGEWAKFLSVDLTVSVPVLCNDGSAATPSTFTFTPQFTLDETPNRTPCAYPGTTTCPDKVTVSQSSTTQTFDCTEGTYTINILGFTTLGLGGGPCNASYNSAAVATEYVTEETADNVACLWAEISAPTADIAPVKTCEGFDTGNPTYRIVTTNAGPGAGREVQIVDTLPSGVVYSSYTSQLTTSGGPVNQGSCTVSGQTVTCQLLTPLPATTVDAMAKWTVAIYVTTGTGAWNNSVTASMATTDVNTDNNTATAICETIAVDLVSFTAAPVAGGILLEWQTATEIGIAGYSLYRADSADGPQVLLTSDLIPAKMAEIALGASYQFLDESAEPGVTYYYWLEDLDAGGNTAQHGPVVATAYRLFLPVVVRLA